MLMQPTCHKWSSKPWAPGSSSSITIRSEGRFGAGCSKWCGINSASFEHASEGQFKEAATPAQQMLGELADDADTSDLWDREYERQLFLWAADRVKARCDLATWQAFWQTAVDGRNGQEIADSLGMTIGAVYTSKSRILDRIRKEIQEAQGEEGSLPRFDRDEVGDLS
jgi:hypothetical protein